MIYSEYHLVPQNHRIEIEKIGEILTRCANVHSCPGLTVFLTSSVPREILHNAPKPLRFSGLLRDTNQSGAL